MQIKRSLLRNISVGRLQAGEVSIFSGKLKCCITKIQILGPEAFLGTRKWSKPIPRDLPGTPKWPKWSPRGPPKTPTITLRTLQGPPRGQLDAPEALQVSLGSDFGSPADRPGTSKSLRFLKEINDFRGWTQCGPNTLQDPVPDPEEGTHGAKGVPVGGRGPCPGVGLFRL